MPAARSSDSFGPRLPQARCQLAVNQDSRYRPNAVTEFVAPLPDHSYSGLDRKSNKRNVQPRFSRASICVGVDISRMEICTPGNRRDGAVGLIKSTTARSHLQ